jgi:hypothetical protein
MDRPTTKNSVIVREFEDGSHSAEFSSPQLIAFARGIRNKALEEAAVKAASFATCPCNGDSGYCRENDPPLAIASAIRSMRSVGGEGKT